MTATDLTNSYFFHKIIIIHRINVISSPREHQEEISIEAEVKNMIARFNIFQLLIDIGEKREKTNWNHGGQKVS